MTIIYYNYIYFNPLPPHGGRPCKYTNSSNEIAISIHSLRMEGDAVARKENFSINRFQSTPSAWRETTVTVSSPSAQNPFQSTPSAWRETQAGRAAAAREGISIHSLRMEGDCMFPCSFFFRAYFNPLPPHGGRPADRPKRSAVKVFQSTPSAWRETGTVPAVPMQRVHFNPLPPHGGRQQKHFHGAACGGFQSTPSAWRETNADDFELVIFPFQSTPSAWRETEIRCYKIAVREISIHSLRMEGDGRPGGRNSGRKPISIHSLRMEGDTFDDMLELYYSLFQSTPSAWRETRVSDRQQHHHTISIHSLRMEGDRPPAGEPVSAHEFQSTPSAWRETLILQSETHSIVISIHSLRMEGDTPSRRSVIFLSLFQSTPSAWRETLGGRYRKRSIIPFQSTPSAWRETYFTPPLSSELYISIHSLRMEGDQINHYDHSPIQYFNPLPPHGGRLHFHFVLPPNF